MQTRTVSITGTGDSPWLRLDEWAGGQVGFQAVATGTVTYSLQTTFDNPDSPFNPVASPTWDGTLTGVTDYSQTTSGYLLALPTFIKATITAGTGTVALTVSQSLNVPA